METGLSLQQTRRLGLCKQTVPWPETDLGSSDPPPIYSARCTASRDSETIWMAHIPTQILDSSAQCRDRIQSDAGTPPAFLVAIHIGRLHAGNLTSEARCASSRARSRVRVGSEIAVVQRECGQVVRTANVKTPFNRTKRGAKRCKNAPFCTLIGFYAIAITLLERLAGTTRLELATSAVTATRHCN